MTVFGKDSDEKVLAICDELGKFDGLKITDISKSGGWRDTAIYIQRFTVACGGSSGGEYVYVQNHGVNGIVLAMHFCSKSKNGSPRSRTINIKDVMTRPATDIALELKDHLIKSHENSIHNKNIRAKQSQINSLTSIIVDGIANKNEKVKAAFEAGNRNSKNYIRRSFKHDKMIFECKLTIADRSKIEKLFTALEEII